MKCIFCNNKFKTKDKGKYGICTSCKIDILRDIKKKEYKLLVNGEDLRLANEQVAEELKEQGYDEIS